MPTLLDVKHSPINHGVAAVSQLLSDKTGLTYSGFMVSFHEGLVSNVHTARQTLFQKLMINKKKP